MDQFSGKYQSFNQELNRCQQALLQSYRDRNSKVRPSPAPAYFSNYPEITTDSDLGLDRLDKIRKEAEKGGAFLKEIAKEIASFSKDLLKLDKTINDEIASFILEIEEVADKETDDRDKS